MRRVLVGTMLVGCLGMAQASLAAEPLTVKGGDTLQKVLDGYKGKRVTIRLQGGEELTGRVKNVTRELLHLEELQRREFFDAVVDLTKVDAVIVRTKE